MHSSLRHRSSLGQDPALHPHAAINHTSESVVLVNAIQRHGPAGPRDYKAGHKIFFSKSSESFKRRKSQRGSGSDQCKRIQKES